MTILPGVYAKNGKPLNIKTICHISGGFLLEITLRVDDCQLLNYSEDQKRHHYIGLPLLFGKIFHVITSFLKNYMVSQ